MRDSQEPGVDSRLEKAVPETRSLELPALR